ncbi:hypothetical protein ACFL4L_01860 [bacterium]
MKQLSWLIILSMGLFLGCTGAIHSKMNAALRQQIRIESKNINFSGECQSEVTPQIRQQIKKSGIMIKTVKGSLFTATGTPRQINKLSKFKIIVRLETAPQYRVKPDKETNQ